MLRQRALCLLALCALAVCTTAARHELPSRAPVVDARVDVPGRTHFAREHADAASHGAVEVPTAHHRKLAAVAAPQPTSGWCGPPPSNTFGTTLGAPGSCLGDVAVAAGAASPQCTATDVNFTIPDLHFHQVRRAAARSASGVAAPMRSPVHACLAPTQVGTCSGPGSFAKVYVEMQVASSAAWKYDLGVYFRLDTPASTVLNSTVTAANVGLRGSCVAATLPPALGDDDDDTCGDLNGRATCVVRKALNVSCVNLLSGTDVTVPVCMTWANTGSSVCAASGLLPSPATSCACTVVTIRKMAVSGVGALYGNLYAPANSIFSEDGSAGGPAPPAPPVGTPAPSLPWCAGQPKFNWGTSSGSQGSCPGDAWNAWGGSPLYPVQCVSQDLDVVRDGLRYCRFLATRLTTPRLRSRSRFPPYSTDRSRRALDLAPLALPTSPLARLPRSFLP